MKIEARIVLPSGAIGPDPLIDDYGITLPLDHIICRDEKGAPHLVREFLWPWTAYDPHKKKSILHFLYWKKNREMVKVKFSEITPEREARIREIQFFMFKWIYSDTGYENGFGTLKEKLKSLFLIARFAESKECTVREILERQPLLDVFITTIPGAFARSWVTWFIFFDSLVTKTELGFSLAKPRRLAELQQRARDWLKSNQQHAPLPTRIYAGLINSLISELDDIDEHAESLLKALREAIALYQKGGSSNSGKEIQTGSDLIHRHCLSTWFKRRNYDVSLKGFTRAVNEIFGVCKLTVHVFSGMRDGEAINLPFHCMHTEKSDHGRIHCLIAGITTKLEGSHRRWTKWVTTEQEGFRAIRIAQRFASVIYEYKGSTPSSDEAVRDDSPLFPSPCYLPWTPWSYRERGDRMAPSRSLSAQSKNSLQRLCLIIEDTDIDELEDIDPFRSWREAPEFAIGKRWPLTTHQLRRSLALYANASGLVRLSSLRRQLQHLAHEMSVYYGRGSTFCKNFIADDPVGYKKHIAPEWQDGNEEAQILAFTIDVLKSKEPLFGGAGNFFQRQLERNEVMSLDEVKMQFKAGLLNYTEGPLGGCTKPGVCSSRKGLNLVDIACATEKCKYLIGKHSRIIQVIRLKRACLAGLDSNTISYEMEMEELIALEKVEVSWRPPELSDPLLPDSGDEHGRHS